MARPLRIEFAGALYHVTSRGNRQGAIYDDDRDRGLFLDILGRVVEQSRWLCYAYCLMSNHYHLLIETPEGNLSKGMRQLNGVYTQAVNHRHQRGGHLFQGRFKAILVDSDSYLLELSRYVVLNPVRAGMVTKPEDWPWSSCNSTLGKPRAPAWLAVDALLMRFAQRREVAGGRYARFVADGIGGAGVWADLKRQVFLGDAAFVQRMQSRIRESAGDADIPGVQRRPPPAPLSEIQAKHPDRNAAIVAAYATGGYSYQQIAAHFGVHFTTVGRIVRSAR